MRRSAGQATVEYIAVIALVAVVLVAAAPAVGAPSIPGLVLHKIRLGICIVAGDVCSSGEARAAGLSPCPLSSRARGYEGEVTVFSDDLGARGTLTMTRQSDGTVAAALSFGGRDGVSGGLGVGFHTGPVQYEAGVSGSAGVRLTGGRGWTFPDAAAAAEFARGVPETLATTRPDWVSVEGGGDVSGSAGLSAGDKEAAADLAGLSAGAEAAAGLRWSRTDHTLTSYFRTSVDMPGVDLPLLNGPLGGRMQWLVEYTQSHDGPRKLVFRHADPSGDGNGVTETVATLDLRDPANWAVAEPLVKGLRLGAAGAVLRRIAAAGTTERSVSTYDDSSSGLSLSFAAGVKFSVGATRIKIDKALVDASAWTPGSHERERFDCQP